MGWKSSFVGYFLARWPSGRDRSATFPLADEELLDILQDRDGDHHAQGRGMLDMKVKLHSTHVWLRIVGTNVRHVYVGFAEVRPPGEDNVRLRPPPELCCGDDDRGGLPDRLPVDIPPNPTLNPVVQNAN